MLSSHRLSLPVAEPSLTPASLAQIGEAYAILSDPQRRRKFDAGVDESDPYGGQDDMYGGGPDLSDLFGGGMGGGFGGGFGGHSHAGYGGGGNPFGGRGGFSF